MASPTQHLQEPTAFSTTETIFEGQNTRDSGFGDLEDDEINTAPKPAPPPQQQESRTYPPVIPPDHSNRVLVLCFDGTGDQFDSDNSNIVQLVSLLKKDDRTKQLVYYQTGIGTTTSPAVVSPLISSIQKTLDMMFATTLDAHVMSGYQFLMQNYTVGDRICIFGFSRGAYTARSLAGMLHKVGLLPPDNNEQLPFAYTMYLRTDTIGWELSNEFKRAFSINVDIEFIGVWDTVDSVGLIAKRLPFTTSNTIVKTFRHALSLDEHRAKFKANLWNRPTAEEEKLGLPTPESPIQTASDKVAAETARKKAASLESEEFDAFLTESRKKQTKSPSTGGGTDKTKSSQYKKGVQLGIVTVDSNDRLLNTMERIYSQGDERQTDIEEVWFAGCHCDIGGGSVSNKTRHALARIPLRWMIREIFKANTGMLFISDRLFGIGMDPRSLYPIVAPRPPPLPLDGREIRKHPVEEIPIRRVGSFFSKPPPPPIEAVSKPVEAGPLALPGTEEDEELNDALSPIYDQLKLKWVWWILEYIPLQLRYQRGDNQWVSYWGFNQGQPRFIPKQVANGVKVHRSVRIRMEAEYENEKKRRKNEKYEPEAQLNVTPTWID